MVESACRAQIINGSSREAADGGARFSQKSCKINTKPQTIYKNEAHLREKHSVLSVRKRHPCTKFLIDWLQLFLTAIICSLPCGFHWQLLFEGKPPWTPNTFSFFPFCPEDCWFIVQIYHALAAGLCMYICMFVSLCVCVYTVCYNISQVCTFSASSLFLCWGNTSHDSLLCPKAYQQRLFCRTEGCAGTFINDCPWGPTSVSSLCLLSLSLL